MSIGKTEGALFACELATPFCSGLDRLERLQRRDGFNDSAGSLGRDGTTNSRLWQCSPKSAAPARRNTSRDWLAYAVMSEQFPKGYSVT
jgi:hypothetical protein